MGTDRELLEAAAKAEGHAYPWVLPARGGERPWNPLTDDGDALRLAVRLNLTVHKGFVYTPTGKLFDHRDYANPIAATRRAIVRAAAEIGRSMK
jgi:hypothetical protein